MPFPQWLARLNKAGLNRVVRLLAPRAPGLALVVHHGRRSGRVYRTPVNAFATGDGFVFALTYGRDKTDWVKNVVAAGGCAVHTRGRVYQVESPRVYHDETRPGIPLPQRQVLRLLGVADFLSVKVVPLGQDHSSVAWPPSCMRWPTSTSRATEAKSASSRRWQRHQTLSIRISTSAETATAADRSVTRSRPRGRARRSARSPCTRRRC